MVSDKINFKLFKPFGSTIAKSVLPLNLMKEFQEDLKQIREDKDKAKNHDWGNQLIGQVHGEYLITPEVMLKWKELFFDPIISGYTNGHYKDSKIESIKITSAWYVVQKPGDYNPCHTHVTYTNKEKGADLSCVGYLTIPDAMKPNKNAKEHDDTSGNLEFLEGSENMFFDANYKVLPEVRDWYLFPSNLRHTVYKFDSDNKDDERISFSFNAIIIFKPNG